MSEQPSSPPDDNPQATTAPDPSAVDQNAVKDPEQWVTGEEPMTGPQQSYLSTLAQEAGVELPERLSKAKASEMIDELQNRTGRGQ